MLPLSGIKVVEWTTVVAGPTAGMILASLGADITLVEMPGGGVGGGNLHRNKRSIAINLKEKEGVEIMRKLLLGADVFLENFAPGATEEFGFGYDAISKLNPKIIFCSIKGYGKGPYEMMPAFDPVIEAASGIMSIQGERGGGPVRYGGALIDEVAAMQVVAALMGALMNREKTGKGDKIVTGMFETAVSIMQPYLTLYTVYGVVPSRMGSGSGASQCFKTTDGWIYLDAGKDAHWQRLCDALGVDGKEKLEFATAEARRRSPERVEKIVADAVLKLSTGEAIKKLTEAGVPSAPVNTSKEVTEDPHLKATKTLITYTTDRERREGGETSAKETRTGLCVALPIRTSYYNPSIKSWEGAHSQKTGESTVEVLRELGYADEQITDLRKRKIVWPYLEGVK